MDVSEAKHAESRWAESVWCDDGDGLRQHALANNGGGMEARE